MAYVKANHEIISDKSKNPVVSSEYVKHGNAWLNETLNGAIATVNNKADKSYVDTELAKKASKSDLNGKADASAVSALQTAINNKADSSTVSALSGRVSTNETNIAAANARIDEIVAIPPGSTEGNTELIDIRTGADGKKYPTAGDAVRGQVTDLKSDLKLLNNDIDNMTIKVHGSNLLDPNNVVKGHSNINGVVTANSLYDYITNVEVPAGYHVYIITYTNGEKGSVQNSSVRAIDIYDENGVRITGNSSQARCKNTASTTGYATITYLTNANTGNNNLLIYCVKQNADSDAAYIYARPEYAEFYTEYTPINKMIEYRRLIRQTDLRVGLFDAGVYTYNVGRLCSDNYFPVRKGDIVEINDDALAMKISEYDINRNFIEETEGYYSNSFIGGTAKLSKVYTVKNDGFVRVFIWIIGNNAPERADVADGAVTIINNPNPSHTVISAKKVNWLNTDIHGQDGTFINGKLWSFSDGLDVLGDVVTIDTETGETHTKTHKLGHCNAVDYCAETDTLITYGHNGNNRPTIVLYKNPESSNDLQLNDSNCIQILLVNSKGHLNVSSSLCFGERPNIVYYITGVYKDDPNVKADKIEIYKILLGMGDNNLYTPDGGYGSFKSGKSENEYNGTCKIIKKYQGDIVSGRDVIYTGNSLYTPQGCEYDGFLYLGWGTVGSANWLKIDLNDNSDSFTIDENYYVPKTDYKNEYINYEPEMLAINGNKIYCGVIANGHSSMFVMNK